MTNTNNGHLTMSYQNTRFESARPGSTTWHKGERCTIVEYLPDTYACPMYVVAFADGRTGVFKPSELGLKASEVAAYLAKQAA